MNTRRVALVLSKLILTCFTSLPPIAVAQVATDQFAWVRAVCYRPEYCWDPLSWYSAGIVVSAFGNETLLTTGQSDGEPSWSPDGTRIAFQRAGEIMMIDSNGGSPANITNHPAHDGFPAWSPDGARIAFASDRDGPPGQLELYLMNVDGSGVVRLTNAIGFIGRPAWSPNGAKIAFDCEVETGNRDICSITIDGTGFLRLTTYPAADFGAAWSPDGSKIAFSTFAGGADVYVLAMMNPDGTGATLVGDFTMGSRPSWSPDGNQIVYSTAPYSWLGWYSIERINTDGTGYASIGSGFDAVWAPAIAAPPGPAAALSPPSLQFGTQSVGTTGSPQSIRLINYGSSELVFSIVASGDFAQANTCNGTVPPRAHYCTINVMFTPTAAGSRGGAVTITDNAPGSPRVVTLSGVGDLPPIASFTSNCIGLTCYFDGSGSADPDGWIVNRLFSFGDGSAGGDSHTYAVSGTYTVTLTVTDNAGGTGAQSTSVTVPAGSMHVGDLDGTKASQQNTWTATVTVTVEDSSHSRLANATVNGSWSGGGTSSCTTNASGQCAVSKSGIRRNTGSATFAVSGVTQALLPYNSTDNHDPDGDSSGTIITVMRP